MSALSRIFRPIALLITSSLVILTNVDHAQAATPTITMTVAPPPTTLAINAYFEWTGTDIVSETCTFDGIDFSPCGSSTFVGDFTAPLAVGMHEFLVTAVGPDGTTSSATTRWTVLPRPPVTVEAYAVRNYALRSQLNVNPVSWWESAAPSPTSPIIVDYRSVNALQDIAGAPIVRYDILGNVVPPSETMTRVAVSHFRAVGNYALVYSFGGVTVPFITAQSIRLLASTPPTVTITNAPPAQLAANQASVEWTIDGTAATPTDQVTCSLDGAALTQCASQVSYDGLPAGPHTITIRVSGTGGTAQAVVEFTVTLALPRVTVTRQPRALDPEDSLRITWVSEATASMRCTLDGAVRACGTFLKISDLPYGPHTVTLTPVGPTGNIGLAVIINWQRVCN